MDLTYKPYLRDATIIKSPAIDIKGYTPKYSTDTTEEPEEVNSVESDIEEIRHTKTDPKQTKPLKSNTTSKSFSSKEDFKNTMLSIYTNILKQKGLNPIFAKALVAQDGLESGWGKTPSGSFNFGGIKGKGTTKRTREVINGKSVYINDNFRDFKSLEDYANYKVNLLNSNRYNAFSGDITEFADRVHKGGYATDPNYSKVLNKIILSIKRGGKIKLQSGGVLNEKEWVQNWYKNRMQQLKLNYKNNAKIPLPVTGKLLYNILSKNLNLTSVVTDPSKLNNGTLGKYNLSNRKIYLKDQNDTSTAIHEWTHASRPDMQTAEIKKLQNIFGNAMYHNSNIEPSEYLDNAEELYARTMEFRKWAERKFNFGPEHVWTPEELEKLQKEYTQWQILVNNKYVSEFNKDDKLVNTRQLEDKNNLDLNKSKLYINMDVPEETVDFLDRYNPKFLTRILNDVAQYADKKDATIYAKLGIKI